MKEVNTNSFEMKQMLLPTSKQDKEVFEQDEFAVSAQELSDLFHPDNIREGVSLNTVKKWGGYKGLERLLKTNMKAGIESTIQDRSRRQAKYGTNAAIVKPIKTLMDMVLENFEDPTLRILCAAAIASLVLGILTHGFKQGWLEGVSILLAVSIIVAVTSFNNYMKEQQFRKLNEIAARKNVNVIRNNRVENINVEELLVGDIVQVETGEKMSVDGIAFSASRMGMDQSSITGQSYTVRKEDIKPDGAKKEVVIGAPHSESVHVQNPFLISGSKVMEGTSMMIVLAVGLYTREGLDRLKVQEDSDETPLQQKLEVLAEQIGTIGIFSASITFLALLIHFIYDRTTKGECMLCYNALNILVEYFIIAVSIIVIAVPEGLPLAVTISLAYSVGKMKDENNLVRFLQACQTMGGANNICTDKTGTLTKNIMAVTKVWSEFKLIERFDTKQLTGNTKGLLCIGACVNSDANPKIDINGKSEQIGNKTECALLQMALKYGYDYNKIRDKQQVKGVIPFSSDRKRMSTVYQRSDRSLVLFTKGAPDFLFPLCTHYISETGQPQPMDDHFLDTMHNVIGKFADQSLRTLLMCYKHLEPSDIEGGIDHLEYNMTVIAVVGIKDPLRPQIPEAVRLCKRAGIIVRMVTGDNIHTAIAIAKESEILPTNYVRPDPNKEDERGKYIVMDGKTFRTLTEGLVKDEVDEQKWHVKNKQMFQKIAKQLRVLARSSPEDKYLLATGLKQMGNVVAMTGDGTNDAPALKKADIGFAMGIAGTEVAKDAAGIILLDDNFKSIVTAVKFGRNIFDCIRKFLQFQLTVNVAALFMAFVGAVIIKNSPLTSIQMLWVNLIMDTLAALALATEPPKNELLLRMPYSRHENIITPEMWRFVSFHALFQIIVLSIILFMGDDLFGVPSQLHLDQDWQFNDAQGMHFTLFFNVFVYLQVFNFLNARKLKRDEINIFTDMFDNALFIIIVVGIFVLQLFIVQNGGKAFHLSPLTITQHLICIAIGSLSLVNGIIIKKLIPETWLNKCRLFHINEQNERSYNVDRYINKILGGPATMVRKSQHKREVLREKLRNQEHQRE